MRGRIAGWIFGLGLALSRAGVHIAGLKCQCSKGLRPEIVAWWPHCAACGRPDKFVFGDFKTNKKPPRFEWV